MKATGRALLRDHLRAGGEMWLPATGASMYPHLKDGDLLLIRGLRTGEVPSPGQIVVLCRAAKLIAHFVVGCEGGTVYTRGSRGEGRAEATPLAETCAVVVRRHASSEVGLLGRALRLAGVLRRHLLMLRK